MTQPWRPEPLLPAQSMKTYTILAPTETHWRPATCEDVDCPNHLYGWVTRVDEATELGQRQAHYLRHDRTRAHTETRTEAGLTEFTFPPGTRCFTEHKARVERPELYVVRGGDHRGNPRGDVQHVTAEAWSDDFGEHQETLADRLQQG